MPQHTPSSTNSHTSLSISKPKHPGRVVKCLPNLLPCRIHHDGKVDASSRYWQPFTDVDGTSTAYFRGRKLRGRTIKIPDGYKGAVTRKTDQVARIADTETPMREDEEDLDEEEQPEESRVLEAVAEFDRVVVWAHEVPPEDVDDPYIKGVEEWISFAHALHSNLLISDEKTS